MAKKRALMTKARGCAKELKRLDCDDELPAAHVQVTFGQHNGQSLGSLPDGYLRVLARMVNSKWGSLAEEVLHERKGPPSAPKDFRATLEQDSYARVLRNANSIEAVESLHAQILESKHRHDAYLSNIVIQMYGKYGSLEGASKVFDGMLHQNQYSWNIMVSAYARNGFPERAKSMFDSMPERNVVTWTAMLRAYASFGYVDEAKIAFDKMPSRDLVSMNTMIKVNVRNRRVQEAKTVFELMGERDNLSYNAMLHALAQNGHFEEARIMFDKMAEWDVVSWTAIMQAYVQNGELEKAKSMYDDCPEHDAVSVTVMVQAYGLDGQLEEAKALSDRIPRKDVVLWTALIKAYALHGQLEAAKSMFDRMSTKDAISWTLMTAAYAHYMHLEDAESMFDKMPEWNTISWNAMVTAYAQNGHVQMAKIMFNRMPEHDVGSWSAIIAGYVLLGRGISAIQLFRGMELEGYMPDEVCFLSVLYACSLQGLMEDGWKYFTAISADYGMLPWKEHYYAMVEILGRSGHLAKAEELTNDMPFLPDTVAWGALLDACRHQRDVERGVRAAEHVIAMDPTNAAPYLLLANLYAAAGKQNHVTLVRKMMEDQGVRKQVAVSWINVHNRLHRFIVGDTSHPQSDKIYAELQRLIGAMEELGYVPDTKLVIDDLCEDDKKQVLHEHSEKLAIAFGLISTTPQTPLRIINNLRVCGDCHAAMKLISNITGRLIILRDGSRLHHFEQETGTLPWSTAAWIFSAASDNGLSTRSAAVVTVEHSHSTFPE